MTYDQKCLDLAEYFLPEDAPAPIKDALAQEIQKRIEDFLEFELPVATALGARP